MEILSLNSVILKIIMNAFDLLFGSSSINECDPCLKYLPLYSSSVFIAGWSREQPLDIGRDLQNLASIRPFLNTGTDA